MGLNSTGRSAVNVAALGVASVLDLYAITKVFSLSPVRTSVALLVATASEVAVLAYTKTAVTELVLVYLPLLVTLAICTSFLVGLLSKPRMNQPEIIVKQRKG